MAGAPAPSHCQLCAEAGVAAPPEGPFWFRAPGLWSKLPAARRVYLRACLACRPAAEARWRAKFAPGSLSAAPPAPSRPPAAGRGVAPAAPAPAAPAPGQPDLFAPR
ncbi:hypothetical protein R5H32_16025 [Defluviimonas sp. D31]|uniref:hypothetical protein n=1 Tax=Defluviimonas sp. D31 TaxID=3083253 RepID=UPI00296E55A0|nr:hypothetical protein [Defluviimonas sp. D31]MDW4550870.1 hypothetical protein [Defluviimonas sp. D31]